MTATLSRLLDVALAAAAGAASVAAFAPFGLAALPLATVALLLLEWQRAATPRRAALQGFAFGLGLFGAGASWVYIALESFGGMPAVVAVVATAGFVAYLALWPAAAGWCTARFAPATSGARLVAGAALFVLAEWLRGTVFTGFPWLALGYSQLPGSPLAHYAPVGGVTLVSLAVALAAAAVAAAIDAAARSRWPALLAPLTAGLALAGGGFALAPLEWTAPAGPPLAVSLVQGNVAQDLKFDPGYRERTFDLYLRLARAARGRLVVLPESAFPMFDDEVPDAVFRDLAALAAAKDGLLLAGLFTAEPPLPGTEDVRYYNTVVALSAAAPTLYRKRHLVPFGETIPGKAVVGWFIRNVLAIPLADQTPGPARQPPFFVGGQSVAVNICYEDAFGAELIDAARSAGILVNVTNDAWYGHSIAARQHNQMAAMRALELGRPLLRATNTGITSVIDHRGQVEADLPWFTEGILETTVAGRQGATPYQQVSDYAALTLAALVAGAAFLAGRRTR